MLTLQHTALWFSLNFLLWSPCVYISLDTQSSYFTDTVDRIIPCVLCVDICSATVNSNGCHRISLTPVTAYRLSALGDHLYSTRNHNSALLYAPAQASLTYLPPFTLLSQYCLADQAFCLLCTFLYPCIIISSIQEKSRFE